MSPDANEFVVSSTADDELNAEPRRTRRRPQRAPRSRTRSEASIQTACLSRLKGRGYALVTTGSRFIVTGTPDILGCVGGRFLAIEVKRPGEKPTPAQFGQLRRWQQSGALVGWVIDENQIDDLLSHVDDPEWTNNLLSPGDGRPQ